MGGTHRASGTTEVGRIGLEARRADGARVDAIHRKGSPYGIAGSPDLGSELRLLAKLDADVAVLLRSFVRMWAG